MEGSSNEQGGDSLANDWRTQHEHDLRDRVIYATVEKLKICFHQVSENDIKNTAIQYEDVIYGMATDKDDYLRKMSRKVLGFHRKYIIVSSDNGANTPDSEAQGQSLPTSLPYTQNPTSQQWLPQINLNTPESSGLPTQVPITTVSAAQNLNIQMSDQGVHSNLLPGPQRQIQGRKQLLQQSSNTMFQHQMNPSSSSGGDWREETYQKIKALKEKYVLVLSRLLQPFSDKLRESDYELVEWQKRSKEVLEKVLVFLNVSKSSVTEFHRDKFSVFEGKVLRFAVLHQKLTQRSMQRQQVKSKSEFEVTLPPEPLSEQPIDRLIKAIQSSSPESLAQSVSEMKSVISLTDRFADSFHSIGGSRAEDLSERTRLRLQQVDDTNPTKRRKRLVTTMPLDSTASSASKVNKIEPSYALLQEIIQINGRLLETVVSICNEHVCPSEVTSGLTIVVKCSYVPVALSATFKALYKSKLISQIQPLRLLVPESYPCSPIILEKTLFDTASVQNKYEDISARTRSRFGLFIEEYSEAMSLKEIAQVWDECARATMVEYAERHGEGTFSTKYGRWESVLRVS